MDFLEIAIEQARIGLAEGGVPVGAALVADGRVLGAGRNRRVQEGSVIRHGETDALERAGRRPAQVYRRSTMYTTLSPCAMCTGAILLYEIPRVVIGENRTFMGARTCSERKEWRSWWPTPPSAARSWRPSSSAGRRCGTRTSASRPDLSASDRLVTGNHLKPVRRAAKVAPWIYSRVPRS